MRPIRLAVAFVFLLTLPAVVTASPLVIMSTPQSTSGPFLHNVFHTASSNGGAGGQIKAWFDLDPGFTSTYDPMTGALLLHVEIFSNSALTNQIGTAVGTGTGLVGSALNANLDAVVGEISWSFNMSLSGGTDGLSTYMASQSLGTGTAYSVTQTVLDTDFVPSATNVPNSWDGQSLSLWGADGYTGGTSFNNAKLGVDVVAAVPEPSSIVALGLGLLAAARARRRRS
jgi:hypothetical protein